MDRPASGSNFIRPIVEADLASGKHRRIVTRFPPEPNGYLHFGHAKSICLNFGLAGHYGGICHLRFDDTNPVKEEQEYVDAIKDAVKWLGCEWGEHEYYASDYFDKLYQFAEALIQRRHAHHHRTGDKWCIYPTYDWAHGLSDCIERVTHSLCTLEFEDHRPLYDWFNERVADAGFFTPPLPQQIEFARLNLSYVLLSKRRLIELVEQGHVGGWDDPRMPTLAGARRRGYTPEGFRLFAERIGVAKADSWIELSVLEDCMREHLNDIAPRRMAVLDPVRLVIENYPRGADELLEVPT